MKCLNCKKKTQNPKFCSRSCAAIINKSGVKRSEKSKAKTSKSMKRVVAQWTVEQKIKKLQSLLQGKKKKGSTRKTEREVECSYCKTTFISKRGQKEYWSTLCSDRCYRNRKRYNAKGIKRQKYNGFIFDSGYEVKIAKYLDKKNIYWEQPEKAIYWYDKSGKLRRYFPDFYLPKENIYLDPKNKFCIQQQAEKLSEVTKLIKLFYGTPEEIINMLSPYIQV